MPREIPLGENEVLTLGDGGWCHYRAPFTSRYLDPEVWVRFEARKNGRLEATELHARRLSPAALREVPLGRIESAANEESLRAEILTSIGREGEEAGAPLYALRRIAPSRRELAARGLAKHEARLSPWTGLGATLRIRPRPGERGPDDFYRDIGAVYERLSATTGRPAPDLAQQAGVSVSTVHRWVKEARRRGLMAPGRRG